MKSSKKTSVRGYIRPTTRSLEAEQRAAIDAHACEEIYVDARGTEQTIDAAVQSLRHPGDVLAVPHLRVISGHGPALQKIIAQVHAIGAHVVDGQGRRTDRADDLLAMIGEATKRQGHSPADARKYGAKGAARKQRSPSKIKRSEKMWRDASVTNIEFERRTGIPYATMRRYVGSRGTGLGRRPRKQT